MVEIILSISALVISFFSLALSFIQSRDKSFNVHHIQIKPLNNSFDLLFNDNNKFSIELINFNNRDLLIYLYNGHICINGNTYAVNPMYYTINANSVTKIEAELSINELDSFSQKYDVLLIFKYKGLLWNRTFKYEENAHV